MPKRKAKKPQLDDTSILLEPSGPQSRRVMSSTSSALLLIIIFLVGVSIMGWFYVQQQQSLDQLSESFTTMQKKVTNLAQVIYSTEEQSNPGVNVEQRILALEEAHRQAQEEAEVAQATSEKLRNSDLFSQILDLHDEMDIRSMEMNQVSLSLSSLQVLFKNQSEEFEAVKESVVSALGSSAALSENVDGLTDAVAAASSRVDQQVASVDALNTRLLGQAAELDELKESMHLHTAALQTNNKEIAAVKDLIKAEKAMRAQALQDIVNAVQMTLDEQFFTSQTLHSSVMAQLQTFHSQLAHSPWSLKSKSEEESGAEEELISSPALDSTEVLENPEDVEEEAEPEDASDLTEEESEEEGEEDQEQVPQEQEVVEDEEEDIVTEEEEDNTPEEQEEEEEEEDIVTEEEEEGEEETEEPTEEDTTEETVDNHILEDSIEEEESDAAEEQSPEPNDAITDEEEEDE
ncbi:uncharacterized protein LOC141787877 [Halichoeres trimaculatus]|uniref:uncharacterized protein LOC141787877 n=1 Tax=Halichoeres trimaculatus TaxID=147232 RepID=UPI003D9DDDA9